MKMRTISLAAAMLAAVAMAGVDAVNIKWKPKAGDTAKYKISAKANIAGSEMNFGAAMSTKVVEVKADGNIVVEEKQSDMKIMFGDQDMSSMAPAAVTGTTTMKPNGEVVSRKSDSEMDNPRMEAALEFVYPEKELNVGDSWSIKRDADSGKGLFARETTFTYEGTEMVGKWNCYKIKVAFKEVGAPTNMEASGYSWVSVEDGSQVKGSYKLKNVEFAPGAPPSDADSDVIRIEG